MRSLIPGLPRAPGHASPQLQPTYGMGPPQPPAARPFLPRGWPGSIPTEGVCVLLSRWRGWGTGRGLSPLPSLLCRLRPGPPNPHLGKLARVWMWGHRGPPQPGAGTSSLPRSVHRGSPGASPSAGQVCAVPRPLGSILHTAPLLEAPLPFGGPPAWLPAHHSGASVSRLPVVGKSAAPGSRAPALSGSAGRGHFSPSAEPGWAARHPIPRTCTAPSVPTRGCLQPGPRSTLGGWAGVSTGSDTERPEVSKV